MGSSVKIKKLEFLSLINKLNSPKSNNPSSEKELVQINKIWMDCLTQEASSNVYLHEFEIPRDLYDSSLKNYLN